MNNNNSIPVNIWDDYYEDGYVPVGKKQETYIYVEDDKLPHDIRKMYLGVLLRYINDNFKKNDVNFWLHFYDSAEKYPQLVGTENEFCLFKRYEIRVENLTHANKDELLNILQQSKLKIGDKPFRFYSES